MYCGNHIHLVITNAHNFSVKVMACKGLIALVLEVFVLQYFKTSHPSSCALLHKVRGHLAVLSSASLLIVFGPGCTFVPFGQQCTHVVCNPDPEAAVDLHDMPQGAIAVKADVSTPVQFCHGRRAAVSIQHAAFIATCSFSCPQFFLLLTWAILQIICLFVWTNSIGRTPTRMTLPRETSVQHLPALGH